VVQLVLFFCMLDGSQCIERRPAYDEPLTLMGCMVGRQRAGAQFLQNHRELTGRYRLSSWRCEVGRPAEKAA
jgi:hypothetical protein